MSLILWQRTTPTTKLHKAVKDAEKTREKSKREREAKSRSVARARAFGNNGLALNPNHLWPFNYLPSMSTDTPSRVVVTSDKKYSQLRCYSIVNYGYSYGKVGHVSRYCVAPMTETNLKWLDVERDIYLIVSVICVILILCMILIILNLTKKPVLKKMWGGFFGAPSLILKIINDGYFLPFIREPRVATFKNHKIALQNSEFMIDAVQELLKAGSIQ